MSAAIGSAAPHIAHATRHSTLDSVGAMKCRDCGHALAPAPPERAGGEADEFYPLPCGHAFCRACLAIYARSSLLAHTLLPLRCCQRHVPVEWVEAVIDPPEAAYYRYLVEKVVSSTRVAPRAAPATTLPAPGWQLALRSSHSAAGGGGGASRVLFQDRPRGQKCDGCSLLASRSTYEMLACGHTYCRLCLGDLWSASVDFGIDVLPPCCTQDIASFSDERWKQVLMASQIDAVGLTRPTVGRSAASMIIIDDDEQHQSTAGAKDSSRRSSKRVRESRAKSARAEPSSDEIDLVDVTGTIVVDDLGSVGVAGEDDAAQRCFTCSKVAVVTTDAACGHSFCLKCIGSRCRQAVKNDKDGGIGFPLRCCGTLLPLETVRPALSKQAYGQYKLLVSKREGDVKQLAKRKRGVGKQKATKQARLSLTADTSSSSSNGSAARASNGAEHETAKPVECVACLSQIEKEARKQFRGPCGHVYCAECLGMMAKKSLEDRSLVPVRCCGKELPSEYIASVLPKRSLGTYNRFVQEKDWKTSNLQSDKEYAKLVKNIGGKQCPKCGIGVQKISGCNAMACSRGHRFCWLCVREPCACQYPIHHN